MKILLLRHGKTKGNLEKRYIGTTDEPLCAQGIAELKRKDAGFPFAVQRVYASPLRRCLETAALLFPQQEVRIEEDLRECDFGRFENKNYRELTADPDYQRWIDSMGTLPFPGGESREAFQARCVRAFWNILRSASEDGLASIGIVAHGGSVMSIMEQAARPNGAYYEFQVKNGCGYALTPAGDAPENGFYYREIGSAADRSAPDEKCGR